MSHVHAVIEEVSQDVVQSTWPVLCRQDQGNLIGFGRLFHIGGDDEEPRVVHGIIIDVFCSQQQQKPVEHPWYDP